MQFVGRHPILSIAWIALLVAVLVTTFKSLSSKVKVITRGEATRLINKEDAVVVDLRQRDDFRKGHIAGSINLLPSETGFFNHFVGSCYPPCKKLCNLLAVIPF